MHSPRRLLLTFSLIGSFQIVAAQDLYVDGNIIGLGYHANTDAPGYITSYADGDDVLETSSTVDFGIAGGWGKWTWWQGTNSSVVAAPVKQMELDAGGIFTLYNCDSTNNFPVFTVIPTNVGSRIISYHGINQATGSISFSRIPGGGTTSGLVSINAAGVGGGMYIRSDNGAPAKVGIGVSNPTEKLDVAGNIKLTGSIVTSGGTLTLPTGNATLLATSGSGSTTRLLVGGTTLPAAAWQGTSVIGATGQNKVIAGYLASTTNGAIIGGHNSDLNAWADFNLAGQNLIFRTGGETERMRINNVGNVGIGTSVPLQKLQISGSGQGTQGIILEDTSQAAGGKLWVTQLRNGPSTYQIAPANDSGYAIMAGFIMDRSGNVGIGTSNPSKPLTVFPAAPSDPTTVNEGLLIHASYGSAAATVSNAGARWGIHLRGAAPGVAGPDSKSAGIYAVSEDALGYNRKVGLSFWTSGLDVDYTERMRIDSSGKVGVGVVAPGAKVHIASNGDSERGLRIQSTTTGSASYAEAQFKSSAREYRIGAGGDVTGIDVAGKFYLWDATAGAVRMVVDTAGNVGLGTTSPGAKLEVAGDLKVTTGTIKSNSATFTLPASGGTLLTTGGNGSALTSLNATQLTSGTLPPTVIPANVLTTASGLSSAMLSGPISANILPTEAVLLDTTQTLTGKTLTSAKLDGTTVIGGSDAASQVVISPTGNLTVGGLTTLNGDLFVNGLVKKLRVEEQGDIGMGDFTSSPSL